MSRLSAFALAAVLAVGGTAYGDRTVTEAPANGAAARSAAPAGPHTPARSSPSPTDAEVGDTVHLTGMKEGEKLAVTVVKVVDPATGEGTAPGTGERYVAVQFRLHNTGSQQYRDAPVNSAKVVDDQGQEFSSWIAETTAGPGFTGTTTLSVGDTALGHVTFKVPEESRITEIQFTMNSGFADDTGEWRVP
ncbi:DUF4352 domain-containing protein [Streptomyces sp. MJP52]|uniref:DUF4352 domain-containing protein n=1 Tax=Streptomyces sp. MJP52 TaxID=2940555 RepID=UPI0024736F5A|nr:DUF4352 domain-containing protein [Streptomyces sp. MJP52]MDH6229256.1 hypothetical protein [Streptomyces sp. MJP52]